MFKYSDFSSYSIQNLINRELYLNHHEYFNDPFECACNIISGFPKINTKDKRYQNILAAWGFDNPEDDAARESYDDYVFSLEDSEPCVDSIINFARISCFSKACDNLLMWSHYADGLRGFSIEFDQKLLLKAATDHASEAHIFNVEYNSKPAVIDTALIATLNDQIEYCHMAIHETETMGRHKKVPEESIRADTSEFQEYLNSKYEENTQIYQNMLATKPSEWSYEEEQRLIIQATDAKNSGEFLKYPNTSVKSIITGEKMPARQLSTIRAIASSCFPGVTLKTASRVQGSFHLKIEEQAT